MNLADHQNDIVESVRFTLAEDIGSGDITAQLIPAEEQAKARVITRDRAIIAGVAWVNEVFKQVDPEVKVTWHIKEGDWVEPNTVLFELEGKARSLLTGERNALNYLQTLSGTATKCRHYADKVAHTSVKLLDTRKTIPGLRIAQKYAVSIGGCFNHRLGLYDAFLIKENHIMACGGIENAVSEARNIAPGKPVEVEVESVEELHKAAAAGADIIMLDNFSPEAMSKAVADIRPLFPQLKLEASGNINEHTLVPYAETGVDFISIGALTKDCQSVDLSMRLV